MNSRQLAWRIRRHAVEMTHRSGGSHIGSILSAADIVAVLYGGALRVDPKQPDAPDRDRFVLSKGHAAAAVYAALAERGFFPLPALLTYDQNGSMLSGHITHRVPGVDFSAGSLGHGLSAAAGMAYALQRDGRPARTFALLGDGECDEGAVWEAALFAAHHGLSGLTAIVDHNGLQSMDFCEKTLRLSDLAAKWRAFGWRTLKIDGHDHDALQRALAPAEGETRPTAVIARTVKGKGVPFMENDILWHYRCPHAGWEYDQAVCALHREKPASACDPYTPQGIARPAPQPDSARGVDYTMSAAWKPARTAKEGAK